MTPRLATLIGGNGDIGRHLQARLRREGWTVWLAPRDDDAELCRRPLGHVFYCAGLTADYAERPHDTVEAHASLLNRVLRDARFESLVYLSSTRLYDGLGEIDATEDLALRLAPGNPRHLYDLSKALGESLCRVAGHGRARVARLSCVWSDDPDGSGFLPELIRRVRACRAAGNGSERRCLPVDASPGMRRDYIHIDDALDALLALATHHEFAIYNVASGRNVDNARLFDLLGAAGGCELVPSRSDASLPMPRVSVARMAETFGWRPAGVLARLAAIFDKERACSHS